MTDQETAVKLWTVAELHDALGVSERTIWRMIEQGRISVTRIGRSVRIRHKEVLRVLQEAEHVNSGHNQSTHVQR